MQVELEPELQWALQQGLEQVKSKQMDQRRVLGKQGKWLMIPRAYMDLD